MIWGYQNILVPKYHTSKIGKIHKDFELYQVFMHSFPCQHVQTFPLHVLLTRRINAFGSISTGKFLSGGMETFWAQKISQEKSTKFTKIFELYHLLACTILAILSDAILPALILCLYLFLYDLLCLKLLCWAKNLT